MSHRSSQSLEVEPEPDRKEEDEARFVSPTLCFVSSLGQIKDRIDYLALGQTELATQQAELLHRVEYLETSQQLVDTVKPAPYPDYNPSSLRTLCRRA